MANGDERHEARIVDRRDVLIGAGVTCWVAAIAVGLGRAAATWILVGAGFLCFVRIGWVNRRMNVLNERTRADVVEARGVATITIEATVKGE